MWYHAGLVYLYLATVVWAWRVTLRHRIKMMIIASMQHIPIGLFIDPT